MSAAAPAAGFPEWVLLEPYVFRRDDDKSFPDATEAPFRASGTTSLGAGFRIAFSLAEPPKISRLYAQLPGFPGPDEAEPLEMVATHRHLVLFYVGAESPSEGPVQNFFIFRADENKGSSSSLTALPRCTVPRYNESRLRTRRSKAIPRLLDSRSMGLWCGDKEEFVVADLTLYVSMIDRRRTGAFAVICLLRSSFDQLGRCKWDNKRVPILPTTNDDLWKFSSWQTDAGIPFQRWLCWIDYHQGILFWDVSKKVPAPTISFLWFPLDKYSLASTDTTPGSGNGGVSVGGVSPWQCSGNSGVSVVDHGRLLKYVYVARHDGGLAYEALKPGTGFTITCHTLVLGGSMEWKEDYTVTSDDLCDHHLPHGLPIFPELDIVRPQVAHFLFVEFGKPYKKMSVLSIDLSTKTVESFYEYMDGNGSLQTDGYDEDFIIAKSLSPLSTPFLPSEFPRFRYSSR